MDFHPLAVDMFKDIDAIGVEQHIKNVIQ
jgi:hypothetical protein